MSYYLFVFEKPSHWTKEEFPCCQANTLKEAKSLQQSKGLTTPICEIWHEPTCNLVWGFEGQNEDSIPSELLGE